MPTDTSPTLFTLDIRVYYEDTDTAGVVFYANYLKFFERGRTEWLRRLGVNQSELAARERRQFVVKQAAIEYRKPARLDDLIAVHSRLTRIGGASVDFRQSALLDGELLCESTIQVVCVDTDTFRPAALPEKLKDILRKVQS